MKKNKIVAISSLAALSVNNIPLLADPSLKTLDSEGVKDYAPFSWNLIGGSQEAGAPSNFGVNFFIPLTSDYFSLYYLDFESSIFLPDLNNNYSSNVSAQLGRPVTTSTRFGRRWLTQDKSSMFGVNLGFDTRPVERSSLSTISFNQMAFGIELVKENIDFNVYGLIPTGDSKQDLNPRREMSVLETYGIDLGINHTDSLKSYIGYYYQNSDISGTEGSGFKGSLEYEITDNITLDTTYTHDDLFSSRVKAGFKITFGEAVKKKYTSPVIQSLSEKVKNRKIRTITKAKVLTTSSSTSQESSSESAEAAAASDPVCSTSTETTVRTETTTTTTTSSTYTSYTFYIRRQIRTTKTLEVCTVDGQTTNSSTLSSTESTTNTSTSTQTTYNFK